MAYAKKTTVPVEMSKLEIEKTLVRYGADQFSYGRDDTLGLAVIQFRAHGRHLRFVLTLPGATEKRFTHTSRGKRTADRARGAWEQACRQKWRALALVVKAKLETVESGIAEFEEEFLAYVVLPDGKTASEWLRPQIEVAYETGAMPRSLPALPAPD